MSDSRHSRNGEKAQRLERNVERLATELARVREALEVERERTRHLLEIKKAQTEKVLRLRAEVSRVQETYERTMMDVISRPARVAVHRCVQLEAKVLELRAEVERLEHMMCPHATINAGHLQCLRRRHFMNVLKHQISALMEHVEALGEE